MKIRVAPLLTFVISLGVGRQATSESPAAVADASLAGPTLSRAEILGIAHKDAVARGMALAFFEDYGVRAIPAIFLIGPDGRIISKYVGGNTIRSAAETTLQQDANDDGGDGSSPVPQLPDDATPARVLHFPADRAIGAVYVRDRGDYDISESWQAFTELAEARGDVVVARNSQIRLDINVGASKDLSPLDRLPTEDVVMISLLNTEVDDDGLRHIARFTSLEALWLSGTQVTDEGLRHLTGLDSLRSLRLSSTDIGDAGLAHLVSLPALESLSLRRTRVTDAGLPHLARLKSLKSLGLGYTDITDAGLFHLKGLKQLQWLQFWENPITDDGLAHLADLTELRYLTLMGTGITDRGLANLKNMKSLEHLRLDFTSIGDEGLAHLKDLMSLQTIMLPEGITDAGIAHLARLPSLEELHLQMSELTDEGLRHLRAIKSLRELHLPGSVTDAGMAYVAELTNLEVLDLQNCPVTDAGLARLLTLKSLKRLSLHNTEITDDGLAHLSRLPALEHLRLFRLRLTGVGLRHIAELSTLRELHVSHSEIGDGDLAHIAKLGSLNLLSLDEVPIGDEGLKHLSGLTNLKDLAFFGDRITDVGLSRLVDLKKLERLRIRGDLTDDGILTLEDLPSLRYLTLVTRKISLTTQDRLRAMPSLQYLSLPQVQDAPKTHPLVGQSAPAFTLALLEGGELHLAAHKGKDIVILDFWATWCVPCVRAMPILVEVAEAYEGRGVVFYAVDQREGPETIRAFLKRTGLSVRVPLDQEGKVGDMYGVQGIPQTVLIGKDGTVQAVHVGFIPGMKQMLRDELDTLLAGKNLAKEGLRDKP